MIQECNLSAGAFATGWSNVLKLPFLYYGYSEDYCLSFVKLF